MQVIRHFHVLKESISLIDLADRYGLSLHIRERDPKLCKDMGLKRFYASFDRVETSVQRGILESTSGDGDTPEAAVSDYCRRLKRKPIVIDAMKPSRVCVGPYTEITWDGVLE